MRSTRIQSFHAGLHASRIVVPILAAVSMLPARIEAQGASPRQKVNFDADWRFQKGDTADANPLGAGYKLEKWRWKSGNDPVALSENPADTTWKDAGPNDDVFGGKTGFAWFRATLSPRVTNQKTPLILRFAGVDDNATVFFNGQRVLSHQGWNQAFEVPLVGIWANDAPGELAVLVENTAGAGGIGNAGLRIGAPRESAASRAVFDDSKWRRLDLPHDWGIEGPFDIDLPGETGKLPWSGVGWYRKRFVVPATDRGRKISLEVDGAMSGSTVYLNGNRVGGWPYGYSSWQLDLTPFIRFGAPNVVAIRLDNLPDSSRWYPGGGIYRDVFLVKTNSVHIGQWGTQIQTQVTSKSARVSVETTLENEGVTSRGVRLLATVLDANSKVVARSQTRLDLAAGASKKVAVALSIPNAKLWSLETRNRYTLVSQILSGQQVLDRTQTPFGVRSIAWSAQNGFSLNGRRIKIQGVCMHHDLGALGAAWNRRAAQRQLQILQSMGVNAIRTSHNPPAPELLDLCDGMGFLVLDEFTDTWRMPKTSNGYATLFDAWAERDLRALVRRDRNHPSVVAWSIGNEVGEQGAGEAGLQTARFLSGIVHSEDPTRPVGSGNNYTQAGTNGFQNTTDIFGYNYKPNEYGKFRAANPSIPIFGSETASTISSRGEYFFPVGDDKSGGKSELQVSSYDLYAPGWATPPDAEFAGQDRNPFVAGEFVWTGFDYLGEPTPYNAGSSTLLNYSDPQERARAARDLATLGRIRVPARSSYFGIVDLAGFPKDRFYLYQSRWRPNFPMAHILPHWNWSERVGQVTPVHVYTSGDEAELFLNGKSLGRRKKGQYQYRLRWDDVVYQPGELRVVAYKNGQKWAQSAMKTTGAATRITLEADRTTIQNDGKDLSFVTVKIADAKGQMMPRAKNEVRFSISGPGEIVATDNGNAIDLTSFNSRSRRAYNGLALVIVRAKRGQSGRITLRAQSLGLQSAQVALTAK